MNVYEQTSSILDSPSHREDIGYMRRITPKAVMGVLHLLSGKVHYKLSERWFSAVKKDFLILHHDFNVYCGPIESAFSSPIDHFIKYFEQVPTKAVEFLDFLECAFENDASPKDNDLIRSINLVLGKFDCPYRLSEFALSDLDEVITHPFISLAQEPIVDDHAIKPALTLFTNPEFDKPNKTFTEALRRHKDGEYSACVTSCATAVEESIKVISEKKGWNFKPGGVGKSLQSFLHQSKLPHQLRRIGDFIAERRNNASDAHANDHDDPTEADARFLIGLSAAFIVFLSSKTQ